MHSPGKIAVAGATGRVGRHVVDVLEADRHDVVAMSRGVGVDVVTGDGLADALAGVETIIDVATGASSEQQPATEFFTTAARDLQAAGERAGVQRMVVVSIIGTDRFSAGYNAAKLAHEQVAIAGPGTPRSAVPRVRRATPGVGQPGDVSYLPTMRTQLVAARTVAEALADLATGPAPEATGTISEIAGPREESLVDMAKLLVARRGDSLRVEAVSNPADPELALLANGALLPGPDAILAGPTFEEWLDATTV